MFIFLDESGDLGFNFNEKKPSTHFVITALVCYSKNTLFSVKSAVKRTLSKKCKRKNTKQIIKELKGSDTTFAVKNYFYSQLLKHSAQEKDDTREPYSIGF